MKTEKDTIIKELVEALDKLLLMANHYGYRFALDYEMEQAEKTLAQARKHLGE